MRTYTLVVLFALLAVTLGLPKRDEEFEKSKTEAAVESDEKEVESEDADSKPYFDVKSSGKCTYPPTEAECAAGPWPFSKNHYMYSGSWGSGYPNGCYAYPDGRVFFNRNGGDCSAANGKDGVPLCLCKSATIVKFKSLGCWNDHFWQRALQQHSSAWYRGDAIQKCADRARFLGNTVFALRSNAQCFTSGTQGTQYQLYGKVGKCGNARSAVYELKPDNRNQKWLNLGCFKDKDGSGRAFEGGWKKVYGWDDKDQNECRNLAIQRSHDYFGLELGNHFHMCFTGNNLAHHTRHGVGNGCHDGGGDTWRLNVYEVLRPGASQDQVIYNNAAEEAKAL